MIRWILIFTSNFVHRPKKKTKVILEKIVGEKGGKIMPQIINI